MIENVVGSIFSFIEEKEKKNFDCTFSTVSSSMRGFLSNGGGGHLRFFHDQLNKVVHKQYLDQDPEFEYKIHEHLASFYLNELSPRLNGEVPIEDSNHVKDCLRNVVHHQVQAGRLNQECPDFSRTLKNINFVRERIVADQTQLLLREYWYAMKTSSEENERKSFHDWKKFVSIYSSYIKRNPSQSYSCAVNQPSSSCVYQDTMNLNEIEELPIRCVNKPVRDEDDFVLKYRDGRCVMCVATSVEDNTQLLQLSSRYFSDIF